MILCGRHFGPELIARLNASSRDLSRRALSRHLCEWLDWKGPSGTFQTTMARIAIKGLESAGHLKLAPVTSPFPPDKPRGSGLAQLKLPPIRATLKQIQPVELIEIGSRHSQRARQCRHLLERFHPLGARLCGCQLRYLIVCPQGILGVLSFSAASRRLQPRDQWIGWDDATRAENLHRIVNNSRFLIRPDGELKHLASHVLALAIRRLPQDWEQRYGYRPWLLESFVDKLKYRGCSYPLTSIL